MVEAAARIGHGSLVIPTESAQPRATVRMESAFEVRGLATGDLLAWDHADPVWRFGERRVASAGRVPLYDRWQMQEVATALVRGVAVKSATEQRREWEMNLSSLLAPALRNGEAVVGVTYTGTVWRGELGPEVPLRVGASASRGLEHIHVNTFSPASSQTVGAGFMPTIQKSSEGYRSDNAGHTSATKLVTASTFGR